MPGTPTTSPTRVGDIITVTQHHPDTTTVGLTASVSMSDPAVEISCPDSAMALWSSTSGVADGLLDGESIDLGASV